MSANPGGAWLEHEGEAPGPEQDTADTGVGNAFHQDIDGFAGTGEASFKHHKSDLHTKDKERGNQCPDGVHGINLWRVNTYPWSRRVNYGGGGRPHFGGGKGKGPPVFPPEKGHEISR